MKIKTNDIKLVILKKERQADKKLKINFLAAASCGGNVNKENLLLFKKIILHALKIVKIEKQVMNNMRADEILYLKLFSSKTIETMLKRKKGENKL